MERKWKGENTINFQPSDEFYVTHWFSHILIISPQCDMLASPKTYKKNKLALHKRQCQSMHKRDYFIFSSRFGILYQKE